jgi:sulfofructose kinase
MPDRTRNAAVIGVGLACLDVMIEWPDASVPVAGARARRLLVQGGGLTATALVAVARLGGRAEYWGAVGSGWTGDAILDGLRGEGVDVRHAVRTPCDGKLVAVSVDAATGERHFAGSTPTPDGPPDIGELTRLRGAGCLLVDGRHRSSAVRAAAEGRRLGVPVVGDFEVLDDAARSLLPLTDYAIVPEQVARRLGLGEDLAAACRAVCGMGASWAAITCGERGVVWLDGDELFRMPAFEVDVVDTTGAGDVFHGAFGWGLAAGVSLAENLRFASATAALTCRALGGRSAIPSRDEVVRFLTSPPALRG